MAKGKFNGQTKNATDTITVALPDLSKMADMDRVTIVSESRAGKTIIGIGETPVVFDEYGKAEVTAKEAKYFLSIDGFELDEVEVETSSDAENGGSEGGAEKSETPENEQNAGSENANTGDELPAGGDDSAKSEENKDDSENANNPDIEKAGAKKNAKGNK